MQQQASFAPRPGEANLHNHGREERIGRAALVTLVGAFVLVPLLVLGACVLPSPAALVAAGPVEAVDGLIRIEGKSHEGEGRLLLTSLRVNADPRLGHYLLARLQSGVSAVPRSEVQPAFLSRDDYQMISQRLLQESQTIAQVVALREAGYDIQTGRGVVRVTTVAPNTPATALLQPGDEIDSLNGQRVETAAELVSMVQGLVVGEPVLLSFLRYGRPMTATLPATHGPVDTEGPVLGAVFVSEGLEFSAPVDIQMESGPLSGGLSGGLMYALGVYNALVTEDITRGHRIAGSGTLRLNGDVGPVNGIDLKVRAAEEAGAEYFIAPEANVVAARAAAQEIKVIPARTFADALAALRQIGTDNSHSPLYVPSTSDNTLAMAGRR